MPYLDKEMERARNRAYYLAHKAEAIDRTKQWAKDNPDKRKAISRESQRRRYNPETQDKAANALRAKAYYAAHPDKVIARARQWNAAHPEKIRTIKRAWRNANRQKCREYRQEREARKLGAFIEHVSRVVVYQRCGGLCGICKTLVGNNNFHVDHIIPLFRGGQHSYANVQIAHPRCNLQKGSKLSIPQV